MTDANTMTCPSELTASELDAVAAGAASLVNVSNLNIPVNANVPVIAAVGATVLGGTSNALATLPGGNTFTPAPFG
jgi:hypothetical protein